MGTWKLPQTKVQAENLLKIMQKPLFAIIATEELYDIYGDDELYDRIYSCLDNFGDEYDVRGIIYCYVHKLLVYYNDEPNAFRIPFEDDALAILKSYFK